MKKVIILGSGGNCVDILDTILDINERVKSPEFEPLGFLDDDVAKHSKKYGGYPVLGDLSSARNYKDTYFVFGIGSERNYLKRREILERTQISHDRFLSIIHPTASVSRMAKVGAGSVIFQNASVTSNALIGNFVLILPNAVISHDVEIGDFSCVTGGVSISGGTSIGEMCYLGTNSSFIGGIKVGKGSLIGMGSVVLKEIPDYSVAVGNPAKVIKQAK